MKKPIDFWIGSGMICLFIVNAILLYLALVSDHPWFTVIAIFTSVLQIFLFKRKIKIKPDTMVNLSRPFLKK